MLPENLVQRPSSTFWKMCMVPFAQEMSEPPKNIKESYLSHMPDARNSGCRPSLIWLPGAPLHTQAKAFLERASPTGTLTREGGGAWGATTPNDAPAPKSHLPISGEYIFARDPRVKASSFSVGFSPDGSAPRLTAFHWPGSAVDGGWC